MSRNYQNHPELYPSVTSHDPNVHHLQSCNGFEVMCIDQGRISSIDIFDTRAAARHFIEDHEREVHLHPTWFDYANPCFYIRPTSDD